MNNKLWAPIVFIGIVFTGVVAIDAAAVKAEEANAGKQLVDVVIPVWLL
jgi:hypothetical protein